MDFNEKFIEPIGYSQAAEYLLEFVNCSVFVQMDGHISGVFRAKQLQEWVGKEDVNGILFWFCNSSSSQKPILAIQKIKEEYQNNSAWLTGLMPNRPPVHGRGLRIVKDLIRKNYSSESSKADILNDIENEPPINPQNFDYRDSRNVNEMRNRFRSNFSSHVDYPFAYFSTKYGKGSPYFRQFFDQGDISHIRYYLGYSNDDFFSGQRIRIILAPCKADGSNLKKEDCLVEHIEKFNDVMLLQYSWPPKPTGTDE
ncbi:hypothetical protein [Algoriphagus sp.]|uniref:hypothetical protein n=1 Tax=Algoriphagus sp. TaxID=1872435 RepID=UPI00391B5B61